MFHFFRSERYDFRDRLFKLAAVNIFSNLMVPLAGLIDLAFLGHLAEIKHLAGVALATVLFNYLYWTFGFLRMGTTGTTAQAMGRGDRDGVLLTALRNGAIALVIGLLILLLQVPLRELGFALLSATLEVKASGVAYYNTLIWGAPAALLGFVMLGWLLGQGRGRQVLLLSGVSNGVNVVLNYLFIVRWGWASAGAGAATAISQYATLLVGLGLLYREMPWATVQALAAQLGDRTALKAAFWLNSNILIRTFALVTTFAAFTNLSSAMGTVVLAANTLLMEVVGLGSYFIDGLAFATETFAGQFRGRGNRQQLIALAELAGSISLLLGLGIALLFCLFPTPLFGLLTGHASVVTQISHMVWWLVPVLGFGSLAYMLDGYFLGLTEGSILRQSTVIAALVGFAPMGAIAWYWGSNPLLWLGLTLFMAARGITLGLKLPETFREADQS